MNDFCKNKPIFIHLPKGVDEGVLGLTKESKKELEAVAYLASRGWTCVSPEGSKKYYPLRVE